MTHPTWRLDHEGFRHAILDLIGAQDPPLRSALLEALVTHAPGTSVAVQHVGQNLVDVWIRGLDNEWHQVGTVDFTQFETQSDPDWN